MGQIVPFPTQHAATKRCRRLSATSAKLIPLIPPSRLFVAGMAALCPALEVVTRRLGDIGDPRRTARERIVERLFLAMPDPPVIRDTLALERLFDASFAEICRLACAQVTRGPQSRRLYALGQSVWRDIESPDLREFAQRCSVFMAETHHLARQGVQTNDLARSA